MIYIEDVLVLQDVYRGEAVSHFENPEVDLFIRRRDLDYAAPLVSFIRENADREAEVEFHASLLGNALLIRIRTPMDVDMDKVAALKDYIQDQFAASAVQEGQSLNDGKYPILVLQLLHSGRLYYQEAFLNMAGRRQWLTEDWMNYHISDETE